MTGGIVFTNVSLNAGALLPYEFPPLAAKTCATISNLLGTTDDIEILSENKVTRVGIKYIAQLIRAPHSVDGSLSDWVLAQIQNFTFQEIIDLSNYFFKSMTLTPPVLDAGLRKSFVRACYIHHELCNRVLRHRGNAKSLDRKIIDEVDQIARRAKERSSSDVTFVFLNEPYIDNLHTWLQIYDSIAANKDLIVVALDDVTRAKLEPVAAQNNFVLESLPITAGKLDVCGNGGNDLFLWHIKVLILNRLVRQGINAIYSDLDTYWLKDARQWCRDYFNEDSSDIVFMRSNDMPVVSIYEYGFAINCGFVACRGTRAAVEFLDAWLEYTALMYDDQIGVYALVRNSNVKWSEQGQTTQGVLRTERGSCKIGVLREELALRSGAFIEPGDQMLIHPRWVVDGASHMAWIEKILAQRNV